METPLSPELIELLRKAEACRVQEMFRPAPEVRERIARVNQHICEESKADE